MRTHVRIICTTLVLWAMAASPALAWLGDGWLEKLSGPGPFTGLKGDFRLVCLASPQTYSTTVLDKNTFAKRLTKEIRTDDPRMWVTPFGCHFLDRDQPRLELGFDYAFLKAKGENNPLDYSHIPAAASFDKEVRLRTFMMTAELRVNRVVDLGIGFGRGRFSSPSGLFGDFSKIMFQPVRVTTRPLSPLLQNNRLIDAFTVRLEGTMFKGGFRDVNFGARPGSFSDPGEMVWGFYGIVDISAFFWPNY